LNSRSQNRQRPERLQPSYEPLQSQYSFHHTPAKFKGFSGPIGSGKTKAFAYEALRLAYLNPGCVGMICAPTYRMLMDVTMTEFIETCEREQFPYREKRSEMRVDLTEADCGIIFRSTEHPDRLRGPNLAFFGVDELTYCKEQAWKILQGRIRDPKARERCGFGAWTPKGYDYVYDMFIGPEKLPGFEAVVASPAENTYILDVDPEFYSRLKDSYDERFYRQEALGEYLDLFTGRVYYAFSDLNIREAQPDFSKPLILACDFNITPMSWLICQERQPETGGDPYVQVLHEIVLEGATIENACDHFQAWVERTAPGVSSLNVRVYGDSSGSSKYHSGAGAESDWDAVKLWFRSKHGVQVSYFINSSNPPVKDRVRVVNSVFATARHDGLHLRAFVDPSCKETIQDFRRVAWKMDKAGVVAPTLDKSDPRRTHTSDAFGYYVWQEFSEIGGKTEFRPGRIF